ncbi:hypothetical protein vseg_005736 [Gypsophila vaccaria]
MGNCSSCVTSSDNQINDYGRLENALHIKSPIFDAKHNKFGCVHSQVGAKGVNQDAALLYQGYGTQDGTLCAVFDGHGLNGHVVSKFVRNQLPTVLIHQRRFMSWQDSYVTSFKALDKEVKLLDNVDLTFSGSTAVVVIKQGDDLAIANLGDSRAVLGKLTENGIQATQLTVDLKPSVPDEAERIRNSKGRVFALENEQHIQRVWLPEEDIPGLAMSRAFGDFDMKSNGIIVTPVVSHHRLSPEDLFVILATDGVWDVLSNDEVVSIVSSVKNKDMAAKAVIDEANAAWKHKFPRAKVDDITVVCLFFHERDDSLLSLAS